MLNNVLNAKWSGRGYLVAVMGLTWRLMDSFVSNEMAKYPPPHPENTHTH